MEDLSRDTTGDGVKETYAMSMYTAMALGGAGYVANADGTVSHTLDTQQTFDHLSFLYEYVTQKQCIGRDNWNITTNVTPPYMAMQISDAEFYNFEHLYTTLKNGDKLEVVPAPYYDGDGQTAEEAIKTMTFVQYGMYMLKPCDEEAAVIDMMSYILRCGMKYLEDFSLGLVQTDYEGITGASDYSAKWLKKFQAICTKRQKDLDKLEEYDEEYVKSLLEYQENATISSGGAYQGCVGFTNYEDPRFAAIVQVPPASSIPLIRPTVEAMVQQFNELYAPKN